MNIFGDSNILNTFKHLRMQLLNACGRDGCGICRKEEEKENVLSYSTVLLYFFFFIKNMIAFKIEVVFMCKAVLDFG